MVFNAGVEDVSAHAQGAAFELPGAVAGRLLYVARLALGVPLGLAVHEVVALLRGDDEVHRGFGAQ